MCPSFKLGVVVSVSLVLAGSALAQRPQQQQRGQFASRGSAAALLQNEEVQKELKLDQAQTEKVKGLAQKLQEKNREAFAKLANLGQEERRQKQRELTQATARETYAALQDVLKAEQVKRLKQIELQQQGFRAFADAELQKVLGLTEAQVKSIDGTVRDAEALQGKLFQRGTGQRPQQADLEKLQAARKEALGKITAQLTDVQKSAWKELTGTPFEVSPQRRRP